MKEASNEIYLYYTHIIAYILFFVNFKRGFYKVLSSNAYHQIDKNTFNIFNRGKYRKLRNGDIEPIPAKKAKGFRVWSGFLESRDLHISALKGNEQKNMSIKI